MYNTIKDADEVKMEIAVSLYVYDKAEVETVADDIADVLRDKIGEYPDISFYQAKRRSDDEWFDDYSIDWGKEEDDEEIYDVEYRVYFKKVTDFDLVKKTIEEYENMDAKVSRP